MNFTEALNCLKDRKYVARPYMLEKKEYICLMPAMTSIWMIKTVPNANAGNYLFTVEDYEATDWELFDKFPESPAKLEIVEDAA